MQFRFPRHPLRCAPFAIVLAALCVGALPATAAASCALQVIPEHPDAAWATAVEDAHALLQAQSGDCAKAVIEIDAGLATLTFTTSDGRRAVRVLHDPNELSPTLDALRVTLPPPQVVTPTTSERRVDDQRAVQPHATQPAPSAATPVHVVHVLVHGLLGARFAGPGPALGPSVLLGASLGLARWEIGLLARWTPVYAVLADDARSARLADVSAGLAVGRQTPLGARVALMTGMMLSAASQHEGWHTPDAATGKTVHAEQDRGQALVGAYAAAVFPSDGHTRLRANLLADVDATHVGENDPPANGLPRLPWWALTLALGVESEVL